MPLKLLVERGDDQFEVVFIEEPALIASISGCDDPTADASSATAAQPHITIARKDMLHGAERMLQLCRDATVAQRNDLLLERLWAVLRDELHVVQPEEDDKATLIDEDFGGRPVPLTSFKQLLTPPGDDGPSFVWSLLTLAAPLPSVPQNAVTLADLFRFVDRATLHLTPQRISTGDEVEEGVPADVDGTVNNNNNNNISKSQTRGRAREPAAMPATLSDDLDSGNMSRESTAVGSAFMMRTPSTLVTRRFRDPHHQHQGGGGRNNTVSSVPRLLTSTSGVFGPSDPAHTHRNIRIFLVRHALSEGNVDRTVYNSKPDHALDITEAGRAMARCAGARLRKLLEAEYGCKANLGHHVRMWVSPYARTRQTAEEMLTMLNPTTPGAQKATPISAGVRPHPPTLDDLNPRLEGEDDASYEARTQSCWVDSVRESAALSEQDFGSFEGDDGAARLRYAEEFERLSRKKDFAGQFWARWPQGESYFDVASRLSAIFSDITAGFMLTPPGRPPIRTVIIVSHGVTIRAFLSTWCRLSPEWVASSSNPPNCSIQELSDYVQKGFVFGGFNKDGSEVPIESIPQIPDTNRMRWDAFVKASS